MDTGATEPKGHGLLASTDAVNSIDDARLDSGAVDDVSYLGKLGYQQELDRALGLFSSFGIAFSAIAVSSALYTTIGVGFGYFGPASFWSFAIGAALQVFAVGLAVAELVSAYPVSGGVYQIVNRITKKPWLGWQTGWWIVIAHTVSIPAVAVAIAPFIANWFGVTFTSTRDSLPWVLTLIVLSTVVNLIGVRVAAFINNLGVFCELFGAVLIVGALLFVHHTTQPLSVLTNTAGTTGSGWVKPLLLGFALPSFIISSFDSAGNAGEETKDAARKAPMGLFIANTGAWIFGVVFYFLIVIAIPNVKDVMGSATPAKLILDSAVGHTVTSIFEATAVLALFACNCVIQLTGVRVMWSQARDGQMPLAHFLRRVNSRRVPINATLVSFVLAVVFALWSSALTVLTAMVALSWALAYAVAVTVGFWALMKGRLPARPFGSGAFAPIVFGLAIVWSVVLCIAVIWTNPSHVGGGMLGAIAVGIVLYLLIPSSRRGKVSGVTHDAVVLTD